MKKLLFLLLLPLTLIAQDFKVGMNYGANANVGEEIELKFELFPPSGQTMPATFLKFDVQWNNKLLEYVSHTFDPYNYLTGEQNNRSHWDGYKFNPNYDYFTYNLYQQFLWWESGASNAGTSSYLTDSDFSVNRYTIQASEDINLYDAVVTIKFKILDRQGTGYPDYTSAFQINWADLRDNRDGTIHQLTSTNHQIGGLDPGGVGAGDITVNLNVPHSNKADYTYDIFSSTQLEGVDYDNDGVIDDYWPKEGETPVYQGNFNSNGGSTVGTLTLDEEYWIHSYVNQNPEWLDDVVTVTDAYKIFQYSLDTDINGGGGIDWEYHIQNILGEVTEDQQVNFDDSYEVLAHINGVQTSANVTSVANGAFNLSSLMGVYGVIEESTSWRLFTPTDNNKTFTLGHGLRGDVDFSHSTEPTAAGSQNAQQSASSARMAIVANRNVETHDLDISSTLVDGKVVMNINLESEGLVGAQFTIKYDDTILSLDNVKFDTGNTMTNFATHREEQAKIYIGSLDQNGDVTIKPGVAYKLTFTPNEEIQNTSGLITFRLTEGIKADGTKVKFNIQ